MCSFVVPMVRKRRAMRPEDKPQISGSKERAMQHRSIKTWGITAFLLVRTVLVPKPYIYRCLCFGGKERKGNFLEF